MRLALFLLLLPLTAAAEDIVHSSGWATIDAYRICAESVTPPGGKIIRIGDSCVIVRRWRANERSCQFITGPHSDGTIHDRLLGHCKTTVLP